MANPEYNIGKSTGWMRPAPHELLEVRVKQGGRSPVHVAKSIFRVSPHSFDSVGVDCRVSGIEKVVLVYYPVVCVMQIWKVWNITVSFPCVGHNCCVWSNML